MIKITKTEVFGFDAAIRGMRNPMNSWDKSDSGECPLLKDGSFCNDHCEFCKGFHCTTNGFLIGDDNDLPLAKKLINAGSDHRKFLRMIHVQADLKAPVYFMAEFDTYKIGTVRNSSSFMHKGISKPFTISDFSVPEDVVKILASRETLVDEFLIYPYETDEYKTYKCSNGREYEVYKNGRVFAKEYTLSDTFKSGRTRHFERKECNPTLTKNGYWELKLGGRSGEKWLLHRLVAYVWCDNPNNADTVDHINGDKNNNSADNLQWVSRSENIKKGFENGLMRANNIRADYLNWKASSKALPNTRYKIQKDYAAGLTQKELADKYNISQAQISVIIRDANSTSSKKELFEYCWHWECLINTLNELRDLYLETKDYSYFRQIRQLLPMGYMYHSTIDLNYEVLLNIYHARKNHKLDEWSGEKGFCSWIKTLPYMEEFLNV